MTLIGSKSQSFQPIYALSTSPDLRSSRSRKRKSYLDNEDSDAKRAKVDTGERQGFTISRSILRELGTDATTRCASYTSGRLNAPTSPQPPTVFHDLETTPSPTPALSLWASTATSLIQPGSFWYMTTLAQAQTRELLAGMNAYTQREIAAFRQASRGKSIGSLPMAFFSGLVSAFNHDADTKLRGTKLLVQRTTRLSAKRKVLPPIVPEHRVTPPFRRSRAPSPSPKPNLSANNASYIKYKYKYKENVKPATPTTTVHAMRRAPYALPARNRHLSIYPQDSQGTKTQRALAYSSLRPATSTRCFGAYPNHYQQCGFF
ncbi:hypothetical protein B0H15DRAFT_818270 [Mycena belliarum]|uniref:Uncharacterized protein n=1 Tax=Mycena belliarum TaxID=1033014 RepID=A0AAD6UFV0_9AGAR|nr:hypothetical protein B0H15DRAFT_818270 [Mycena belliae]